MPGQPCLNAPPPTAPIPLPTRWAQVSLVGHVGARSKFMGAYRRTEQRVHGYPLQVFEGGGRRDPLALSVRRRRGVLVCDGCGGGHRPEQGLHQDQVRRRPLPTQEEGVVWQYWDGSSWNDDSAMACTEVGGVGGSSRRHSCAGRRRCRQPPAARPDRPPLAGPLPWHSRTRSTRVAPRSLARSRARSRLATLPGRGGRSCMDAGGGGEGGGGHRGGSVRGKGARSRPGLYARNVPAQDEF